MANTINYPVKRPDARIATAVISSTVFQQAMLALQRTKKVGGVTQYYFRRSDITAAARTLKGPARLALDNMQRYFAKNNVRTVPRETLMRFIEDEARAALLSAAGSDGKLTGKEKDKLPAYIRDEFEFITKGTLP